ncbi:MAG: pyruvate:ferredoxin (flavodoxin) oxidoreductase [Lachnospirales bacterium]
MAKKMLTMDGNTTAAYVSYAFTEVAGIYPITPSSPMAEVTDEWSAHGRKNIFGQTVKVCELQSEGGAAGAMHGSLSAGALTTSYTASQGLLLMIPNMYKMAGELQPGVLHVSARALASHALSIFGDHSDVMAARQTGFAMLASCGVQEIMDLGAVAHLASIKSKVPFMHFFDGFRSSSEIQKVECLDYDDLAKIVDWDAIDDFRKRSLNPERPITKGTAQNPDIFFQAREASNKFYDAIPGIVQEYMSEINKLTGRDYKPFNYYGDPDADRIIIGMGSGMECVEEVIDYLRAKGEKVGLVKVRLYRPFSTQLMLDVIPKSVKKIAVLDRTKEPGALGEPLYQDVCTAYFEEGERPVIVGGRYGLGSKDFTPSQVAAIYKNLEQDKPKNHFTVGIVDDVTNTSLVEDGNLDVTDDKTYSCKFWGLGSDGTVGANKNSIKIIGDNTDKYVQAYFEYDSKKSGGVTQSHLRFGDSPIRATYFVKNADFVALHNQSYIDKYNVLDDLKEGGKFLLNTIWSEAELEEHIPAAVKRELANKKIQMYTIDATHIAMELGLGNRTNTVLQAAFFKITNIIPYTEVVELMKKAITKTYGKKGEKIVKMNHDAVDRGTEVKEFVIPASWANATDNKTIGMPVSEDASEMFKNIVAPVNSLKGYDLPVSTFTGVEDGVFHNGSAAFEKRGIAVNVPKWSCENCIQCNQCSYVCPHAAIRPFLADEEEMKNAPAGYTTLPALGKGLENISYKIQVTPLDCTGCGNCAQVCPGKKGAKALEMTPIEQELHEMENWYFALKLSKKENPLKIDSVKGSQFEEALFEFSGACAGCGETPYAKLVTQLFGDRMIIANATGCSSIWGGSAPSTPFTTNKEGNGPAWANSLFEDNAEYGFGMHLGTTQLRERLRGEIAELATLDSSLKDIADKWAASFTDGEESKAATKELLASLEGKSFSGEAKKLADDILHNKEFLIKKSQWIVGGDGWAYDIGYGGLDHVLASGEDVNVLVFDTEVYSNTGGQSSKASPTASVAKFAASGKKIRKKDLGMMAMSYGYVYVAQVAMGANQAQVVKALKEAESYKGPSLVIAYSPCIAHGIRTGMGTTQLQSKKAVEAGYWHLYRYNPELEAAGKNPFTLDSKEPTESFQDFINGEVRYTSLKVAFPEVADDLFKQAEIDANRRYKQYKNLSEIEF